MLFQGGPLGLRLRPQAAGSFPGTWPYGRLKLTPGSCCLWPPMQEDEYEDDEEVSVKLEEAGEEEAPHDEL